MRRFFLYKLRVARWGALAVLIFVLLFVSAYAQANAPIVFTILGPEGVVARAIVESGGCPQITVNGNTSAMQQRAAPSSDFPVTVCDRLLPANATAVSVNGQDLKLPKAQPQRVIVIGDTGCRLKGDNVQSCNDPAQWPFAQVADSAAKTNPDVVIHVGDYHYRESPCIVDKANCAGSPYGDNWAAWNADFFVPGASLLKAAPWVIVVGNHEDCARAGIGFFLLLDPRAMPPSCPTYTDPYAINYLDPQLIVLDDSAVDDFNIKPDQVAAFTTQFGQINQLAKGTTWLLLHDPMYVFGHAGVKDGKEQLFQDQPTLQQASNNTFPPSVQMFIGGHIHLFEVLNFDGVRPPQLVVGNSGTLLDPPVTTPLTGLDIAGMKVSYGTTIDRFGFVTMERGEGQWALGIKNVSGGDMDKCVLKDRSLLCGQAALPKVGGDFDAMQQLWLVLVALGAAVVFVGMALGVRGMWMSARA